MTLDRGVWSQWAFELLKMIYSEVADAMEPVLDRMGEVLGGHIADPLYDVLFQESGTGHAMVLRLWGNRLTDEIALTLLKRLQRNLPDRRQYFSAIPAFEERKLPKALLQVIAEDIPVPWTSPPANELNRLIFAAFRLDSEQWLARLVETFNAFPSWGMQWVEAAVNEDNDALWIALSENKSTLVADFYVFLHVQYPGPGPQHDGAYSPGSLDHIHELKSKIIYGLARSGQPGSTAALKVLQQRFPSDNWMQDCVIDADHAERAQRVRQLTPDKIKLLRAAGIAMAMVVRNESDLLESVTRALSRYQVCLQGDQARVTDLWYRNPLISPRNENYVSSHLVSFLRMDLNRGTIVNREVEIQEKKYPGADAGSRTDTRTQTAHKDGSVLTLCIEVKCNWNKGKRSSP